MKKIITVVIWITFWIFTSSCSQDISPLTIGFWNVENLFDLENDPEKNDDEFAVGGRKNVTREIYDLKIKNTAEVLADLNADVVGLCEVETQGVLIDLNDAYTSRDYKIVHYESPDFRGIDNALLYDPSVFKVVESRAIGNPLPNDGKTRDILYVEGEYGGETIHLFVNHWPSNYGGRKKAIPKRAATAQLIVKEISKILLQNAGAEIVLLGDFNENPDEMNVQSLKTVGLTSLMEPMIGTPNMGTYVYRGQDLFYDQIVVSEGLKDKQGLGLDPESVMILDLMKYRQQEGDYAHYPFRFWAGNRLLGGYSDHLAVRVTIILK
ncbi:MAG: endonuclease/exonuclease/phosphatase family protein [Candidatus Marinimicrobia bacterium]|nr:endonuclease/exonuclease/phosphatase family protein [Candidatus Neomarinimicrobiota bacterium]MBL7009921.1 endonuclease/exonuclease/phosphatase family protein [Candidatus Neomarinimicrobiota bacterium]MBL7029780.1 endonuclease/exonuclease/phosphatase family protein [Candidatus Neomarinimicrobiota bacterium]